MSSIKKAIFCSHCAIEVSYSTVSEIVKHFEIHDQIKLFGCQECDRCYDSVEKLRTHRCAIFNQSSLGRMPVLKYEEIYVVCSTCGGSEPVHPWNNTKTEFSRVASILERHGSMGIRICKILSASPFRTSERKLVFPNKLSPLTPPEECTACHMIFKTNKDATIHFHLEHNGLPFVCTVKDCKKAFSADIARRLHSTSHIPIAQRALFFSTAEESNQSSNLVQIVEDVERLIVVDLAKGFDRLLKRLTFFCERCKIILIGKITARHHPCSKKNIKTLRNPNADHICMLECTICSEEVCSVSGLQTHLLLDHNYTCDIKTSSTGKSSLVTVGAREIHQVVRKPWESTSPPFEQIDSDGSLHDEEEDTGHSDHFIPKSESTNERASSTSESVASAYEFIVTSERIVQRADSPKPIRKGRRTGFSCDKCSKRFMTNKSRLEHEASHEGDFNDLCEKDFGIPYEKPFWLCRGCVAGFEDKSMFDEHIEKHIMHNNLARYCDLCSTVQPSPGEMESHEGFHQADSLRFWCNLCPTLLEFPNEGEFLHHLRLNHKTPLVFFCKKCDFASHKEAQLIDHLRECVKDLRSQKATPEKIIGIGVATSIRYQPKDISFTEREVKENPAGFIQPSKCAHSGFIYAQTSAVCAEPGCHTMISYRTYISLKAAAENNGEDIPKPEAKATRGQSIYALLFERATEQRTGRKRANEDIPSTSSAPVMKQVFGNMSTRQFEAVVSSPIVAQQDPRQRIMIVPANPMPFVDRQYQEHVMRAMNSNSVPRHADPRAAVMLRNDGGSRYNSLPTAGTLPRIAASPVMGAMSSNPVVPTYAARFQPIPLEAQRFSNFSVSRSLSNPRFQRNVCVVCASIFGCISCPSRIMIKLSKDLLPTIVQRTREILSVTRKPNLLMLQKICESIPGDTVNVCVLHYTPFDLKTDNIQFVLEDIGTPMTQSILDLYHDSFMITLEHSNLPMKELLDQMKSNAVCRFCFNKSVIRNIADIREHTKHTDDVAYSCDICATLFSQSTTEIEIIEHMYSHVNPQVSYRYQLACSECNSVFQKEYDFRQHGVELHKDFISSDLCAARFKNRLAVEVHTLIHKKKRSLNCCVVCASVDGEWIPTKPYIPHKFIHCITKQYQCKLCLTFRTEKVTEALHHLLEHSNRFSCCAGQKKNSHIMRIHFVKCVSLRSHGDAELIVTNPQEGYIEMLIHGRDSERELLHDEVGVTPV